MQAAKPLSKPDLRYRADVIGSMLRPEYLLKAREQYAAGNLVGAEFKRLEDGAVGPVHRDPRTGRCGCRHRGRVAGEAPPVKRGASAL